MIQCLIQYCSTSAAVIVTFILAVTTWIFWSSRRPKTLPPGPPRMPVIGNLTDVKGQGFARFESITQLTEKYGKDGVCTIYHGTEPTIYVSDYETIKRMLNDEAYAGRPYVKFRDALMKRKGLLFNDGALWREHRRFALSTLRDFGMGKTWLQDIIIEEAQELVQDIQSSNGKPVNPSNYITPTVANVICAISYGKRFNHKDERFRRLTSLFSRNIALMSELSTVSLFPILRFINPFSNIRANIKEIRQNIADLLAFLRELVDDHRSNLEGEPRDYIHAFLNEQARQQNNPDTTFTDFQLEMSILNLFAAGTETTSTTLIWAIIYLLQNPDVYAKVQAEVDSVIPDGSFAHLEEKESLPYMNAVIMEVQRVANLVPYAFRSNVEDTVLNGYKIPANTTIMPSIYAIHMNPKFFPNPLKFDPNRFLDESGKIKKVEGFFPFSIGKRFCLGESLAKMELYIFFATLLKYFNFKLPPGQTVSTENSSFSIVNSPRPYNIIFEPRS